MNIILIMIPLALLLLIAAGIAFFWATNHGQFDNLDSPSLLPMSDNLPDEDEEDAHSTAVESHSGTPPGAEDENNDT